MKAKDLFIIILKIFGIYLIKDVLLSIPPVLNGLFQMAEVSLEVAFFSLTVSLLSFGLHLAIVYLLLFKTSFLISKLKLTSGLSEEPLVANLHRSSVYTIAIIVTGLITLAFAIPNLIKQLYSWIEFIDSKNNLISTKPYEYSNLLIAISEVIIGSLFLGNQRNLVNFIESRRRESKIG